MSGPLSKKGVANIMRENKTKRRPEWILPLRLSPEDMKAFTRAAKASVHKTLSRWIRRTLIDASEKQ